METLKNIYLFNYLKSHKMVSKLYTDLTYANFYASYLMVGKMLILLIYPFIKIIEFLGYINLLKENSKIIITLFIIPYFIFDYFFIEKRIDRIIKQFRKKNIDDMKKIQFNSNMLLILLIIVNVFFILT